MRRTIAAVSLACAFGCGARSGLSSLDEADDLDAQTDDAVVETSVVRRDSAVRDTRDAVTCVADTDALAAKIEPGVGACTTVVRVARSTTTILGYRMFCGPYATIDEATAAKKSQGETGVGIAGCFGTKSISGAKATDDFVFHQGASAAACACCGEGWFTAVGVRNGMTLLGGNITFGDGRDLAFPKSFDPPGELGTACAPGLTLPPVRGWDLTRMAGPGTPPSPLGGPLMESLLRTVWATALPEAIGRKQYVFDAVVLLYAPRATEPTDASFFVLINSGWLE